jgi:hypothetical protein
MTSKDSAKGATARPIPPDINSFAVDLLRKRAKIRSDIIDPGRLPTVAELQAGLPFYRDSISRDIVAWCETSRHQADVPEPVLVTLQIMRDRQDLDAICQAEGVLHDHGWPTDRLVIYRAMLGDNSARAELADAIRPDLHQAQHSFVHLIKYAVSLGVRQGASCMDGALEIGIDDLVIVGNSVSAWCKAVDWHAGSDDAPADDAELDAEFLQAVAEDRAEVFRLPSRSVVVVPTYVRPSGTGDRSKPKADFHEISGKPLPLVMSGDVRAQKQALLAQAPHLEPIADALLTDAGTGPVLRIKPTILVGEPGTGKSWIARMFAAAVGSPITIYGAASLADGTFMGTAAHWSTSNPSLPMTFINQCRVANPIVCVDEVDKAVASHNGSLHDALLPFLDRGNARQMRDLCLEIDVDLSHVNYILTANSIQGIPAPLRDRCRILRVPNPEWQHAGTLIRQLVAQIALDRQADPRMYPPFAQDELEVIRAEWSGGSIRQLRLAIEASIDNWEEFMKGAAQ